MGIYIRALQKSKIKKDDWKDQLPDEIEISGQLIPKEIYDKETNHYDMDMAYYVGPDREIRVYRTEMYMTGGIRFDIECQDTGRKVHTTTIEEAIKFLYELAGE